jgi:hypothetical protein
VSRQLERRSSLPQASSAGRDVKPVLPASPQKVFALVVDYTSMTMDDLNNIRTLIGGGNGPVVKLKPELLQSEQTGREAILQLGRALLSYPCNMLFLLVPWGMPNVEPVIEVMVRIGGKQPLIVFAIGRIVYSVELALTIEPLSEGDAELRQDPEANAPELQWAVRQPWSGAALADLIADLEEMRDD